MMKSRRDAPRSLRIAPPVLTLALVVIGGASVIYELGGGRWSFGDAVYHAVNAVSTVGFTELRDIDHVRFARAATGAIIIAGLGAVAYFQSSLTALLVQGVIGERLRSRRMQTRIGALRQHIIVAGAGSTGMHVIEELTALGTDFVVIDRDREVLERISRELVDGKMLFVIGDATDDTILTEAGITRCRGIVAALTEDKDNLFVTLSARSLNATARIVSKVIAPDAAPKMMRAGATSTVSPNMIGGRRMASEIVRPTVVEFLDQMLREKDEVLRLEEVVIPEGSWFVGKTLREVPIRAETNLLVVALRVERTFLYNPEPSTELEVGSTLIVLGQSKNVERLKRMLLETTPPG